MKIAAKLLFGPYRLEEGLGNGGMGSVWRALDTRLERFVALKFLAESDQHDEISIARFQREGLAISKLNHPNVMTVYDAGVIADTPYLCSELVEGKNLRELIDEKTSLPSELVIDYGLQLLSALAATHSLGIIHRDVKPLNVMIRPDGVLKLLDFGIAKREEDPGVSLAGHIIGTPRYMAPERLRSESLDPRSDLFSVGALLYELAAGKPAFEGSDILAVVQKIMDEPVEGISPETALSKVILKALNKDPSQRYATAQDFSDALRECQSKTHPVSGHHLTLDTVVLTPISTPVLMMVVTSSPALGELAEGIQADASCKMSHLSNVKVKASMARHNETTQILDDFVKRGVDFLIQAKIRGSLQRLRFSCALIRVQDGEQVWGDTLEISNSSAFEAEDTCIEWLIPHIQSFLQPTSAEESKTQERVRLKLENIRYVHWDRDSVMSACSSLAKIHKQFPNSGLVCGRLSLALIDSLRFSTHGTHERRSQGLHLASRSIELCSQQPYGHLARCEASTGARSADWQEGLSHLKKALMLAPENREVQIFRTLFDAETGRPDRAVRRAERLLQQNPEDTDLLPLLGIAWQYLGEFHRALEVAEKILRSRGGKSIGLSLVLFSDVCLGENEKALQFAEYLRKENVRIRSGGGFDPVLDSLLFIADALRGDPPSEGNEVLHSNRISTRMSLTAYAILKDEVNLQLTMSRLVELGFRNTPSLLNDPNLTEFSQNDWFKQTLQSIAIANRGFHSTGEH